MSKDFNEFMTGVGDNIGKRFSKAEDALGRQVSSKSGPKFTWGLVILFAGALFALYKLFRVCIYFFG